MPYAEGRTYNDADSHFMETKNWLFEYADPKVRPQAVGDRFHHGWRSGD